MAGYEWRRTLELESPRILGALVGSTLATSVMRRGRGPTLGRELGALVLGLAPALVARSRQFGEIG